ncbi:bifunctional diaminohydroxyphosphoribosylaminopyrimidine deaminase/5-amino-6-(5-phosphoribosylamino)uracil reductase RibD [Aquabacter sp. L1I39]|uniref:bifunctional diaminohydroxyphosphoribosylaminopyrimidine deaminase/5-amino-6-(5-phosphoribosylamino)uracil reductase RibD n=1 Tax=Aquabacter sp. L1I39 TaxID=2820278 RepID=UPI001ADB313F|nr:bifunctional diaminohydroxyphosphoribosylaminopyrimidine deaminase/5-amino-6-(5-phosphoribosylamino)uracil reductase RibD [Aquabacter sp. L1I39]QTL06180.1 bifunctional diaminohydroxyphosphoribosylaminopyrimidine deaminase/5-amino-6-(5-phosphoribosylamino)uracil reductase RibD [Aquabacter sp. L1I39]
MARALAVGQAGLGRTWPNPSVGAVVVRHTSQGPEIIGEAGTAPAGRPHAEPLALAQAGEGARGATLYVTLEPCSHYGRTPPCADAVVAVGIRRVVTAIEDPDRRVKGRGVARLRAAGIWVTVGVGAEQAFLDHAGHISRVTRGRPHVLLKMAVSADGKVGLPGPKPVGITGPQAGEKVHGLRAQTDVILVGIGTALADDPLLTCRLPGLEGRSPVRVVLDGDLRLPLSSRLVGTAEQVPLWVVCAEDAPADKEKALVDQGVEVYRVPRGRRGRLDLSAVMHLLGLVGVTRVMVEGGPHLAAGLLEAGLVDEVAVFQSPVPLGDFALDALPGQPLGRLLEPVGFVRVEEASFGVDRMVRLVRR